MVNSLSIPHINSPSVRHFVTLAGQVVDALTQQPMGGARVKIVEAPDGFVQRSLARAKLLVSLKAPLRTPSLTLAEADSEASDSLKDFQAFFINPATSNPARWNRFDQLLNDDDLSPAEKLSCYQYVLDFCSIPSGLSQLPWERTHTTPDGWFYFLDLPDGHYRLAASLPGAGTRYGTTSLDSYRDKVNLVDAVEVDIQQLGKPASFFQAHLCLMPTALAGRVTDADGNGIKGARVQIAGRKEIAVTSDEFGNSNLDFKIYSRIFDAPFNNGQTANKDKAGYYILPNLEAFSVPTDRALPISVLAPGQLSDRTQLIPSKTLEGFALKPGEIKVLDFQLKPKSLESLT